MTQLIFLELVSALLGLTGAVLLALKSRWAGWAWVVWLVSNVGWVAFGAAGGHWFLVAQNLGFSITSLMGVWTWLVKPFLTRRWV